MLLRFHLCYGLLVQFIKKKIPRLLNVSFNKTLYIFKQKKTIIVDMVGGNGYLTVGGLICT